MRFCSKCCFLFTVVMIFRCEFAIVLGQPHPYVRQKVSRSLEATEETASNERRTNRVVIGTSDKRCRLRREINERSSALAEFLDRFVKPWRSSVQGFDGKSKRLSSPTRDSHGSPEQALETPNGHMTDVGVEELNVMFTKFRERAANLTLISLPGCSDQGDNRSTFSYTPHTRTPGVIELARPSSSDAKMFNRMSDTVRLDGRNKTVEKVEAAISATSVPFGLSLSPRCDKLVFNRSVRATKRSGTDASDTLMNHRVTKCNRGDQKQKPKIALSRKLSQYIRHLGLTKETETVQNPCAPISTYSQLIKNALNLKSALTEDVGKKRKRRSEEKNMGNVIRLELKEILSTTEATKEVEEATAPKLALVIPNSWFVDPMTPRSGANDQCHMSKSPTGTMRVHSRARQHVGGYPYYFSIAPPPSELVNLLMLFNKSNSSKEDDYDDGSPDNEDPQDEAPEDEEDPLFSDISGKEACDGVSFSGSIKLSDTTTETPLFPTGVNCLHNVQSECDEANSPDNSGEKELKCTSCAPRHKCTQTKQTNKCGCFTNNVGSGRCKDCGQVTTMCPHCAQTSRSCSCSLKSSTRAGCNCGNTVASERLRATTIVKKHFTSWAKISSQLQPQLGSVVGKASTALPSRVHLSNVEIVIPRLNLRKKRIKYKVGHFPQVALMNTRMGGVVQSPHNRKKHKYRKNDGEYFGPSESNYPGAVIKKGGVRYIPFRVLKLTDADALPLKSPVLSESEQLRANQDFVRQLNQRILHRLLNPKDLDAGKYQDSRRHTNQTEEYDEEEDVRT